MKRLVVAFALTMAVLTGSAHAQDAEIAAAQQSIERQLLAFRSGDVSAAYNYAAPNIKLMFPTEDIFMSMVRSGYRPVQRSTGFSFGPAQLSKSGRILQRVTITGDDGKVYEALYTMERQADGSYLISGVSLRGGSGLST